MMILSYVPGGESTQSARTRRTLEHVEATPFRGAALDASSRVSLRTGST